jgi:hypothetical protein
MPKTGVDWQEAIQDLPEPMAKIEIVHFTCDYLIASVFHPDFIPVL